MKYLPNLITLSRIVSALALLPIPPFSRLFFVVYTYCGVSDILDGALARRLHFANEKGAELDSIADIIFYACAAFKIMPSLCNILTPLTWCIIAAAALLRIISYAFAAIKYRRFDFVHTYMNKLTGFLVFAAAYIIFLPFAQSVCVIIGAVAVLAAAQELIIHIRACQYCADRKTLFRRKSHET